MNKLTDNELAELIQVFADHYNNVDDDSGADLNDIWGAFLAFNHIDSDTGNVLAQTINELAAEDNDDEEDDCGIMSVADWQDLSDAERLLRVKNFLAALANYHNDFRDIKPFITKGPGPDPYGNDWGEKVKVFDRKTNRFGHNDNPTTPKGSTNSYLGESVSRKHFREVANTIRAIEDPKKRQAFADHHASIFSKQNPRFDHAKFHEAAGTRFSGKTKESAGSLPNLPIHEGLLNPSSNIDRYAAWMEKNPAYVQSMNTSESPKQALMEAGRLRDEHNKKFSNGEADYDPSDYIFGRTTKGN